MTAVSYDVPKLVPTTGRNVNVLVNGSKWVRRCSTSRINPALCLTLADSDNRPPELRQLHALVFVIFRWFPGSIVAWLALLILAPSTTRGFVAAGASRRASLARPGRARLVQVERPTGRTTWTRRARSGCLRCAMGRGAGPGIPELPGFVGGAPAAGGRVRVVGPEALPAGGVYPLVHLLLCGSIESRLLQEQDQPYPWRRQEKLPKVPRCPGLCEPFLTSGRNGAEPLEGGRYRVANFRSACRVGGLRAADLKCLRCATGSRQAGARPLADFPRREARCPSNRGRSVQAERAQVAAL